MAAVDGLVSGLDTSSIIKQLMQLERMPQQRLQTKQNAAESSIGSLRTLNTKFLSILTAAEKLGASLPGATVDPAKPSEWQPTKATSSDALRVTASAVSGAPAGALTFHVKQLATAGSYLGERVVGGAGFATSTDGSSTTLTLTKGADPATATTRQIDTGDGSLASTVKAINDAKLGVTASMVQVKAAVGGDPAEYRLQLTSTTTGAQSALSLTNADGTELVPHEAVAAQDAVLDLGGGVTIERSSNTISDVLDGVTLTLTKADTATATGYEQPAVTISVTKDSEGIAAKVQALVDAANAARGDAKSLTAFDPITKAKGRLYGDSTVRGLVDQVRSAIGDPTGASTQAGISVGRDGTISFDKTKFLDALAKDPAAVEAALGADGLAGRLHELADGVSRSEAAAGGPGLITTAIKGRESQIETLKSGIASWDNRLALKEKMLQRQYTALETALGKAQSQGQWLAGQLASLPKTGG